MPTLFVKVNLGPEDASVQVVYKKEVVVGSQTAILLNLPVIVPALWEVASQEALDCLFYSLCVVEIKEHHKVNIASTRRVQHTEILNASNTANAAVTVDSGEFDKFFISADKRLVVVNNKKRIVILSILVNKIKVVDNFWDILTPFC